MEKVVKNEYYFEHGISFPPETPMNVWKCGNCENGIMFIARKIRFINCGINGEIIDTWSYCNKCGVLFPIKGE